MKILDFWFEFMNEIIYWKYCYILIWCNVIVVIWYWIFKLICSSIFIFFNGEMYVLDIVLVIFLEIMCFSWLFFGKSGFVIWFLRFLLFLFRFCDWEEGWIFFLGIWVEFFIIIFCYIILYFYFWIWKGKENCFFICNIMNFLLVFWIYIKC